MSVVLEVCVFVLFSRGKSFHHFQKPEALNSMHKSSRKKGKIRWSKLYSFSCFQPRTTEPIPAKDLIGQIGFCRTVFCNEPQLHKTKPYNYGNNSISTTKYNAVTFMPKALFEQFRRVANLYFLLAAALSFTSSAPVKRETLILPLVLVVGISMIKEAVEDWYRFLQVIQAFLPFSFFPFTLYH